MKKLKLIIVGTVFFLFSCQKNTDLEVAPKKEQPQESTVYDATMEHWKLVALTRDTLISVDTAKELALQIAEQMQPMGKVTKSTPIEVESIEFVKDGKKVTGTSSLTNKGNTVLQPDIYVVTFSGNQGYAVVSADNRIPGTLAYSSQGTFNLDDKNNVNKMLLKRIDNYMKRQKKMFEQKQDSLRHIALQDYFKQLPKAKQDSLVSKGIFSAEGIPTYKKEGMTAKIPGPGCGQWMHIGTTYHDWEETYRKPPLVKTLWAQTDDYNQQVSYVCPTTLKKAPVGCVAVAVGQIMAPYGSTAWYKAGVFDTDSEKQSSNMYSMKFNTSLVMIKGIQ